MYSRQLALLGSFIALCGTAAMAGPPPACTAQSTSHSTFNASPIRGGSFIWFNANFNAKGIPKTGATIYFNSSTVTFTADQPYAISVPNGQVTFDPTAACASTTFDSGSNTWKTRVPVSGDDEILLTAAAFPVPASFAATGGQVSGTVTWQGSFTADTAGITADWSWSAAVYSVFSTDYNALSVKPTHNHSCLYNNADHAGTPEGVDPGSGLLFKTFVLPGARGGGGSNWTGSSSGSQNISACAIASSPGTGSCTLGYPYGAAPALSSVVFSESDVLQAFAPLVAQAGGKIMAWYSDEHALTLGVRETQVKTDSKTTVITDYPFTPLLSSPGSAQAFPLLVGATALAGAQAGTDTATFNSAYAYLDHGRPMWPALFITDITSNPNGTSGDWQQGGTGAFPPNAVYGTWKGAVRVVDQTRTPWGITTVPDADPARNQWSGIPDTPPGGFGKSDGYGAEIVWYVDSLGLLPGHTYRLQFMVHDGDQNKSGGDAGQACTTVLAHMAGIIG